MSTILKKSHWNWINIAMYVIEIIVAISVIKFLMQLFGGTGGVGAGIASVFGAGANFINGISDGCSKQQDCSEGKASLKDCKAIMNCSFRQITVPVVPGTGPAPGPVPGPVNTCVSTNGTPAGGGISTLGCLFGIGAIIAAFTAVISAIGLPFTLLGEDSMTDSAKNLAKMLGGKIPDYLIKKAFRFAEILEEGLQTFGSVVSESIGVLSAKMVTSNALKEAGASTDIQKTADKDVEDSLNGFSSEAKQFVKATDDQQNPDPPEPPPEPPVGPDLSLNTTEQAVLEGKYNDQSEIKDNIDSVITTVFSSN